MPLDLAPLARRDFRLFFAGAAVSLVGDAIVPVAWPFAVLHGVGGVADVGVVLAAEAVPFVALLLVAGVVADRLGQRRVMLAADLLRTASIGAVAGLLLAGAAQVWSLVVLAAVTGAGQAFAGPATTGLMPRLLSDDELHAGNGLRGLAMSSAGVAGPALAGALVAGAGAGWAFTADAASFAVSVVCLALMRVPAPTDEARPSMLTELREGWREFASRRWLWGIVAQFGGWHLLTYGPFLVLGAVISARALGGAGAWAAITACIGAGSVVGSLLALRMRPRRPLAVATWATFGWAPVLVLLAVTAPVPVICAAGAVAGLGISVFGTLWETTLQQQVAPGVLSRVSAYDWFGSAALLPVGLAVAAPLGMLLGYRVVLGLGAAYVVVSGVAVLALPEVRTLRPGRALAEPQPVS